MENLEKIKKRNFSLTVGEGDHGDILEWDIPSDIRPLLIQSTEYWGEKSEKYLIAQDGRLFLVTSRWSTNHRGGEDYWERYEVEELVAKDVSSEDIQKIAKALEELD